MAEKDFQEEMTKIWAKIELKNCYSFKLKIKQSLAAGSQRGTSVANTSTSIAEGGSKSEEAKEIED